jgi:spoIIIJ-associated protein
MDENVQPITEADIQQAHDIISDLLQRIGVSGAVQVTNRDEMLDVVLDTEESGIVIGYHGEALEALQLVFSLLVSKTAGHFMRVNLEVGDYKKNRSEYLERLAMQTKERVLTENQEHALPALKSWERRVVHLILQNDEDVESESIGDGKDRVLVVRPRKTK